MHAALRIHNILLPIFLSFVPTSYDAPIKLGAVCRDWRSLVRSTRLMWRLDVLHLLVPLAIPQWIELAGPLPISLIVKPSSTDLWRATVFQFRHCIISLRLHGHHQLAIGNFPELTCLMLFDQGDSDLCVSRALSKVNPMTHPKLFRITIDVDTPHVIQSYHHCPTVQDLALKCLFFAEWHPMLVAYAPTLVCLVIDVDSPHPFPPFDLELPMLVVLTLLLRHRGLRLVTPSLKCLISLDNAVAHLVDPIVTTKNVVSLIWLADTAIPVGYFPALGRLAIQSRDTAAVLNPFFGVINICPQFALMILADCMADQDLRCLKHMGRQVRVYTGPIVYTMHMWRLSHLPLRCSLHVGNE